MANVLIAGESWISSTIEYKGYDSFTSTKLENGCAHLVKELEAHGHSVTHLFAHDVPELFPWSDKELDEYDVVILSDIVLILFCFPIRFLIREKQPLTDLNY